LADNTIQAEIKKPNSGFWETFTVLGVFLGGFGFVAQFMGLRGLAYPCSIAQLVAIFLMTLIRALIRRRLGRIPLYCPALTEHELEYLAHRIVFSIDFREFPESTNENKYLRKADIACICRWRVTTPSPGSSEPFLVRALESPKARSAANDPESDSNSESDHVEQRATIQTVEASPQNGDAKAEMEAAISAASEQDPRVATLRRRLTSRLVSTFSGNEPDQERKSHFNPASSQQLLRVRERLGNLCTWRTPTTEIALALAQSIEHFMTAFFPGDPSAPSTGPIEWLIESSKLVSGASADDETDAISVMIQRNIDTKKWEVEIGKIESALSLWMSNIESEKKRHLEEVTVSDKKKRVKTDWRRLKAGIGSKDEYCRILGDNFEDGVLKRDISWWVSEEVAGRSDPRDESGEPMPSPRETEGLKLVIGFNGPCSEGEIVARGAVVTSWSRLC
jgi:hypothetical protein